MRKLKRKEGFTLIELVVVMAIIAVLALLIIGAITVARNTAVETANRSNARGIQTGIEAYYAQNKDYPAITAGTTFKAATGAGGKLNGLVTDAQGGSSDDGGVICSVSTATATKCSAVKGTGSTYNYVITISNHSGSATSTTAIDEITN